MAALKERRALRLQHLGPPILESSDKAEDVNSICFPQDSSQDKGPVPSMMENAAPIEETAPQTPQ